MTGDEAWEKLKLADAAKDMDDIRDVSDKPGLILHLDTDLASSVDKDLCKGCGRGYVCCTQQSVPH